MGQPKVSRPKFPPGYLENPTGFVEWSQVEARLAQAKNYWLCSVHPENRPHVIPKWGVWVNDRFYFDGSPETRHARNIALNPRVALHLESGENVVVIEGTARALGKPAAELAQQVAAAYSTKYAADGYAPEPDQWDAGGLFEITPHSALAWTSFTDDPTKFLFDPVE